MRYSFPPDWQVIQIHSPIEVDGLNLERCDALILSINFISTNVDLGFFLEELAPLLKPSARVFIQTRSWWGWTLRFFIGYRSSRSLINIARTANYHLTTVQKQFSSTVTDQEPLLGRLLMSIPLIDQLCPYRLMVLRVARVQSNPSVSIIIPCKNEAGNIDYAVREMPHFPGPTELIFVVGTSSDGTYDRVIAARDEYPEKNIIPLAQQSKGKKSGVLQALTCAQGDVIIIFDGDVTVPGRTLQTVYHELAQGRAEFINGTRLVYAMPSQAMPFLNTLVNHGFAWIFSYLLQQRLTDTLCGTKAWWRKDTQRILSITQWYGDTDPFGDFDFICGAAYQHVHIHEVAFQYRPRHYGSTQIAYWRDGWTLLRISLRVWWNYVVGR